LNQGPFAPPELPGFLATTDLSATSKRPGLLLAEFRLLVTRQHRRGFPCCVRSPCACMPPPNTPAEPCGACVARFPQGVGLPRFGVGSASATSFRGLLGVHCALQPACSLNPQGDPFLEVLQQKSLPPSTASSATGRSDRGRAGIAPAEKPPPFHGTRQRTYLFNFYSTTTKFLNHARGRRATSVSDRRDGGTGVAHHGPKPATRRRWYVLPAGQDVVVR
jgi:hypothetical protein